MTDHVRSTAENEVVGLTIALPPGIKHQRERSLMGGQETTDDCGATELQNGMSSQKVLFLSR